MFFKHTPVHINLTSCLRTFLKNNYKKYIFLKVQSQSQKNRIKQQGNQVDQLYIHSEVLLKHISTSRLVHVQLNNQ